jgi:hypothetical protein
VTFESSWSIDLAKKGGFGDDIDRIVLPDAST